MLGKTSWDKWCLLWELKDEGLGRRRHRKEGTWHGQEIACRSVVLGLERGEKEMGRLREGVWRGRFVFAECVFTFWRDPLVISVKNESEDEQSGVCSICVLGCTGWFRTQCQQMGAESQGGISVRMSTLRLDSSSND